MSDSEAIDRADAVEGVDGSGRPAWRSLSWGSLAVALAPAGLVVVVVAVVGRGLWFFSDDWNILAGYHSGGLLEPFNGHLSLVPAGLYQLLFHTVGVGSYLPYRVLGLVALAVLGFQVARLAVHRLGDTRTGAVVGFLAVAAVLWNSAGTMNLMFPFLMNFTIPVAALAAIWWHLDRRSLGGDVAASAWLAVALGTSGLGVMTAGAVTVELLVGRAPLRRWLALAPGPVLWAIWFLTHRDANEISTDVPAVLAYTARMLFAAAASVTSGWAPGGVLVVLLAAGYLVVAGVQWRSLDGRVVGALAAPVAFALFTAVTRLDIVPEIPPDELRYSWAIVAYVVLAALVAARPGPLLPSGAVPRWAGGVAAGAALVVLVVGAAQLVPDLRAWNRQVEQARPGLSAVLFATEAIGTERIDRDRVIPLSYVPVTTGGYLSAVDAVGSPIAGEDAGGFGGPEDLRTTADRLFVEELPIEVDVSDGSCPEGGAAEPAEGDELTVRPGSTVLIDGAGDAVLPLRILLARFTPPGEFPVIEAPGFVGAITIPDDAPTDTATPPPYRLQVPASVTVAVCE